MPYLFDEFGQRKEVSNSTFYLSGVVDQLFDDILEILGGRVEVQDFRQHWYQLVPFILFVIRVAHDRAGKDIDSAVQAYISDQGNPDSYLNRFNNPEYKTLRQYDFAWLVDAVTAEYKNYWELYNQPATAGADPSFAVNEHLGKMLTGGNEHDSNLQDAFDFLNRKFQNGDLILFEP